MPDLDAFVDHIDDDVLRLIFLTCHPALSPESRAALTLRLVGGLTVPEIARAFLTKDATVGQRISRAKKTLEGESFDLPVGPRARAAARRRDGGALPDLQRGLRRHRRRRLDAARPLRRGDPAHPDARRRSRRRSPTSHGLLALMELQASRLHARTDADGRPVLLDDQDRSRWDELMIRRGLAALDRAMAVSASGRPIGPYVVQAQIAACHARATTARRRPTGVPSRTGTTCSPISATTPWSRSTGRSPTAEPSDPRPGWRCWTRWPVTAP